MSYTEEHLKVFERVATDYKNVKVEEFNPYYTFNEIRKSNTHSCAICESIKSTDCVNCIFTYERNETNHMNCMHFGERSLASKNHKNLVARGKQMLKLLKKYRRENKDVKGK